jgi:hypothetical protein
MRMNNLNQQNFQTASSNASKATRSSLPPRYQITWDSVLTVGMIWLIWFLFLTIIGMWVALMLAQGYGVRVSSELYFIICGILATLPTVPAVQAFLKVNQ